jgi:superfamily II RNA helicase
LRPSTVAAGVDFPARTVVISNADTRGNDGWRPLQASELQQMTGRAGRRGKDNVGFVVLAPSNFQNPPKIAELLKSPPDDLQSKFRATYTSLLICSTRSETLKTCATSPKKVSPFGIQREPFPTRKAN